MSKIKAFLTKEPSGKAKCKQEIVAGVFLAIFSLVGIIYYLINHEYKVTLAWLLFAFISILIIIYNYKKLYEKNKYLKNTIFTKTYDKFLVDFYTEKMKEKLRNTGIEENIDIQKEISCKTINIFIKLDIFVIEVSILPKLIELGINFDLDIIDKIESIYNQTQDNEFSMDYFETNIEIYQTIKYTNEDNLNDLYGQIANYVNGRYDILKKYEVRYNTLLTQINEDK